AEVKGRQVLEKFNCAGCHQLRSGRFDFKLTNESRELLDDAMKKLQDDELLWFSFPNHNAWVGTAPARPDRLTAVADFDPSFNPRILKDDPNRARNGHPVDSGGNYVVRLNEALRYTDGKGAVRDIPAGRMLALQRHDLLAHTTQFGGTFTELMIPY